MKNMKWIAMGFVILLIMFFVGNVHLMTEPASRYFSEETTFTEFRDEVQEEFQSNEFFLKNQFINFNGWFASLIGKREINGIVHADNGMLFFKEAPRLEMGLSGQKLANTNEVLKQMGIPFVYVQAPSKIDLEKEILPVGIENYYNENADSLLAELAARDVRTIDLRPAFCSTQEDVQKYFYRTDHHWNYRGAFKAFQLLVPEFQNIMKDDSDASMYMDEANWELHNLPDSFLGSQGKRVGKYVTGLDDFEYYLPRFETDMTMMWVQEGDLCKGSFEDCIVRKDVLEKYQDYFSWESVIYCSFIGSDYGLIEHRNRKPAVRKRILVIKDSYALPLQAYLSTVFEEVDVVDMRVYTQSTLIEYVQMTHPDLVVLIHNPSALENLSEYNYGYEKYGEITLVSEKKSRLRLGKALS